MIIYRASTLQGLFFHLTMLLCCAAPLLSCLVLVAQSRAITLSLLLGPFGAVLRWRLSLRLNPLLPRFPLGTFLANLAGTLLYCLLCVAMGLVIPAAQASVLPEHRALQSDPGWLFLEALLTGFCGGLTTMSTFVAELYKLPVRSSYMYMCVSVLVSYICLMLINGLYFWMADQPSVIIP